MQTGNVSDLLEFICCGMRRGFHFQPGQADC